MLSTIDFKIITPEGLAYSDQISQVTLPTASGEITILPHHTPLVSLLRHGEMTVKKYGQGSTYEVHFAVAKGVVEVKHGSSVSVLADSADRADEIDLEKAEQARARAEQAIKMEEDITDIEFFRLQAIIEKELNRLKIGGKYGRK
jgi:F-type H+-transporting ATPase subunit epsilon